MTNILAATEAELRKLLDLSGARVTRTDRTLTILCRGKQGARAAERCMTLHRDGGWETTGYPAHRASARILAKKSPIRRVGPLPSQDLRKVADVLRPGTIDETAA